MKYILLAIVLFLGSCVTPGDLAEFTGSINTQLEAVEQTQIAIAEGTAKPEDLKVSVDEAQDAIIEAFEDLNEAVVSRTEDWVMGVQGLTPADVIFSLLGLGGLHAYRNTTRRRELKPVLEKSSD